MLENLMIELENLCDEELHNTYNIDIETSDIEVYKLYDKLIDDNNILIPLKWPIYCFMDGKKLNRYGLDDIKDYFWEIKDCLENERYRDVIRSLTLIKSKYTILYNYKKDLYDKIYKIACSRSNIKIQFMRMKNDKEICDELKKYIESIIEEQLPYYERERRINYLGYKIIHDENDSYIYNSVRKIISDYNELYNLNKDFFDEISRCKIKVEVNNPTEGDDGTPITDPPIDRSTTIFIERIVSEIKNLNIDPLKNKIESLFDSIKKHKKLVVIFGIAVITCTLIFRGIGKTEPETDSMYQPLNISRDYIIKDSDLRYLNEEDLSNYTSNELAYIRNEIYARHGYIFPDKNLQSYFESKSWYKPNENYKGDWESLNNYEQKNIQLIKSIEDK
ncbi:MAG: YARHG domain-containing protein [Intestinibacter bartlettii]|uniref:YARHG domain-containing protein n=1 Tax=Intestinibacter bartlettii TaxID=261299 RepID=UPI00242D2A31|nr:YARHG domain-containing protein [Intestinibacter bartlettii]MBS7146907.1 YARHG domain-containing protein [Intestinibacter bartlettii]